MCRCINVRLWACTSVSISAFHVSRVGSWKLWLTLAAISNNRHANNCPASATFLPHPSSPTFTPTRTKCCLCITPEAHTYLTTGGLAALQINFLFQLFVGILLASGRTYLFKSTAPWQTLSWLHSVMWQTWTQSLPQILHNWHIEQIISWWERESISVTATSSVVACGLSCTIRPNGDWQSQD